MVPPWPFPTPSATCWRWTAKPSWKRRHVYSHTDNCCIKSCSGTSSIRATNSANRLLESIGRHQLDTILPTTKISPALPGHRCHQHHVSETHHESRSNPAIRNQGSVDFLWVLISFSTAYISSIPLDEGSCPSIARHQLSEAVSYTTG